MDYKICTKCGEEFPATSEFFNIQKRGKYGFQPKCKGCCKQYRQANKIKINMRVKKWRESNKEKISVQRKKHRQANKVKINVRVKKYRRDNKEELSIKRKKYRQINKEKIIIQQREYQQINKEKISARHKKYRKDNPDKVNNYIANYRAKKFSQIYILTETEKDQIELLYRKRQELGSGWHVDHIIPISKGGFHHPANLQIVTAQYNLQKHDKLDFRLPTGAEKYKFKGDLPFAIREEFPKFV